MLLYIEYVNDQVNNKQNIENNETKTPYLLNSENYLSELIVKHLPTKLKHMSVKQTVTELRQKFWLCRGRNFVRRVLKNCFFM